jgi:hypothetical protein
MQANVLPKWAMCLIMMSTLFSCADHLPPVTATQYRVKKISSSASRSSSASEYFYNSTGRVEKRVDYASGSANFLPDVGQPFLYSYNNQGQLTSIEGQLVPGTNFVRQLFAYDYDQSGLIKTIRYYRIFSGQTELTLYNTRTLDYNEQKLISKTTDQPTPDPVNNPNPFAAVRTYSYVNGNISELNDISLSTSVKYTYTTYDDKLNPNYAVQTNLGILTSRNNYIDSKNRYTYNNAGLLTSVVTNYQEPEIRLQSTATFEYETY